jgi:hypothetical protein
MLFYWLLFIIPASLALSRQSSVTPALGERALASLTWVLGALFLALVIGFRHEVGGDWANYLPGVEEASFLTFVESLRQTDPGYGFFNWLGAHLGGGIYTVNMLCGLVFSIGLVAFIKQLPRPSLALAVATPYLILVVAMGYSRQGVALGIAMVGLKYLQRDDIWKFLIAISVATLFHKSAVVLVLLGLCYASKRSLTKGIMTLCVAAGLYLLFLVESIQDLRTHYLDDEYQSAGAGVRVAMNALPAAVFLCFEKRFQISPKQRTLWKVTSLVALAFLGALVLSPSTTAVDRLALYLIPLQLFVWSHFPNILGWPGRGAPGVLMVLLLYGIVLFTWLNFAHYSVAWIPYKFYPLELL